MSELIDDDVITLARQLIAIDTTNTGGPDTVGERTAAEFVAASLVEAGGRPVVLGADPARPNVVLRLAGANRDLPAVVLHGHLDTVPAEASAWAHPPLSGALVDDMVWGRGALDMKGADAVLLAVARRRLRTGQRPRRDVVFAFVADEENGGGYGSGWLCAQHPGLFAGCEVAIGEVGGFSLPLGRNRTLYPVMTSERGAATLRLTATGAAGHAAVTDKSAIATLCAAVGAVTGHSFGMHDSAGVREFLAAVGPVIGAELTTCDLPTALVRLGPLAELIRPVVHPSAVPTMIAAGSARNVVPANAQAVLDCRFPPGGFDEFAAEIEQIVGTLGSQVAGRGGVGHQLTMRSTGMACALPDDLAAAISATLLAHDPTAIVVPYPASASTDAVHFAALGMTTIGFTPLRLPLGFPYGRLFHGVDERVPVAGLHFGVEVLDELLSRW